ncbi:MAG: UDP-N-acetylglucosamine 1-carboxyvinyltransferase [Candidatus Moranbacteria bacterium]|nr:UDP-N-acetylglucosamine 1-carboxyvinyltransferase [Candidatus Moranbacteria bacterium]OIQ02698.1 MAG: UDP-N-acetylglucosamine 1-carboxyvinyltransferase [Candidatus Moranbacteria bacterium CG2_30_41_165]PIP25392.1 MAG: UDP-N-acetylglucosamine 1-carboxyvinyltransferase [Candidatus Moranbacteria bacterium CG23_combo_of_CG06-09_8_20_14_all_41_28]PIV86026.1 MAG: UDP-N-acetylglucosamine 1-carboxyvinyltransferase [Candidatus Moranbacteria bacterium CG17_big_fil_post_rev_8_21_14_2_50_41_107]PIW93769
MEVFEIEGGKKMKGEIVVSGSKNATTPILAATLLTKETCVISNLPLIEDVFRMIEIIESMGALVEWRGKRTVAITAKDIDPKKIDIEAMKKIRSSILLLGSLSARFDMFTFHHPGGCVIGARPVGTHFDALQKMGIDIKGDGKKYTVDASKKHCAEIILREFSVTATENIMMLASSLPGKTIIKIAATEPHVEDLGKFLIALGAKIRGLGTHTLEIIGSEKLCGAKHTVIPDHNEAGTFLILGVATGSPITVKNARVEHLDLVLEKLREFGADFVIEKNAITVVPAKKLRAIAKLDTRTYPGLPTDVQAPFGVLASQAIGDTLIFDTIFEGRFNYIPELVKMGAQATVLNPHQVIVNGKTLLRGTLIKSYDLRAGAALIIAALCAKGKTVIEDIYQVDRGYERIEERLQKIGASIRRVDQGCK